MPDQSLRTFLANLEQRGELIRFSGEVDPAANMAAIEWKAFNELGKASLFTSLRGHDGWRAASQILADRRKWSIGLGIDEDRILDEIARRIARGVPTVDVPAGEAPVQEVVAEGDAVNVHEIPSMMTSEHDGGRYLASGMAVIRDPDTGVRNVSVHRQMILNERETGFIMVPRQARRIYDKYAARGLDMPVAMVYGGHPALFYGAGFTTGFDRDELEVAGALIGEGVRMVKCRSVDLEVPAEAELVLEGHVLRGVEVPEGPFGEIPGTYAEATTSQVLRVDCMTRRRDPIFYAVHCGYPTTDTQGTMALGVEVATREHLRNVEGGLDLLDVRCHPAAGMMMLVVKLRPRVEGQAKTALMAALSGPYLHPKMAVAGRRGHRRRRPPAGHVVDDHPGARRARHDHDPQHQGVRARQRLAGGAGPEQLPPARHQVDDRRDHAGGHPGRGAGAVHARDPAQFRERGSRRVPAGRLIRTAGAARRPPGRPAGRPARPAQFAVAITGAVPME